MATHGIRLDTAFVLAFGRWGVEIETPHCDRRRRECWGWGGVISPQPIDYRRIRGNIIETYKIYLLTRLRVWFTRVTIHSLDAWLLLLL